jgi:RecB family endonuclease NucS
MTKALVKCDKCGAYIPLKDYPHGHACGVPINENVDLSKFSHKQVLNYYYEHAEEIEPKMVMLIKELPIFRGRIDLVGRDKNGIICLIEVVHRSKWDRKAWIKKLQVYRSHLRSMGQRIFQQKDLKVRLLLKKSGGKTEDVTNSLS